MPDNKAVVNPLPYALGQDTIEALARYDRSSFAADYAIGNQPWLSAAHPPNNKIVRLTTQYQKERVDQEASAGENSLSNWWLRSATSWNRGGGSVFYDADEEDRSRFRDSANIDVWQQGELQLLPATEQIETFGGREAVTCALGAWLLSGDDVYVYTESTSTLAKVTAFTGKAQALTTDGCSAIVGAEDGIYVISPALTVTKLFSLPSGSTEWLVQTIGFVKDRIIAGVRLGSTGPFHVLELARSPISPPVAVNLTDDSRYTSSSSGFSFVAVTETTAAILVATNTGIQSRVLSFTIDTNPNTLGAMLEPITVAEFPVGEVIRNLKSYLSTFVIAATNRGVRVGVETENGLGFRYGPLSIEDDVTGLAFNGEYVFATRREVRLGSQGLWRLDLGADIGDNRYASAADLSILDEQPLSVAFIGTTGRALITTTDSIFVQHPTRKAETGFLTSGWIRFGTTERKQPVSVAIRSRQQSGTLGVRVADPEGDVARFDTIPIGQTLNVPLSAELLPNTEFEVTITMTRGGEDDLGPILEEWQLRALPAPVRSRTITIPLMCWNDERDTNGVTRTTDAWSRVVALEKLEQSGGACLFQDFSTGEERICVIRAVQFEQEKPPSFTKGFGGMVTLQLQTVDVEIG
jgi:hypothetical protein